MRYDNATTFAPLCGLPALLKKDAEYRDIKINIPDAKLNI